MILIVDDKAENLYSLKSLLTLHSFPVDMAAGGEEALKKILTNSYALIILDVQMPGMDGFEVAETISGYSKSKDIPIIFLTAANTDKQYITKGYSSGGVDYITKPIDPDILLLKVKTLYRIYEQSRRLSELHNDLLLEVDYRKKAEKETSAKAAELRSILESIPQIAFTINKDGSLEFTNSKWLEFAASSVDFPLTHEDDIDLKTELKKTVANEEPWEAEVRLRKKDSDDFRYHLVRLTPVKENDKIVKWAGTLTDIEEQKRISQRKDEFLSIASHELKTPLTSIKAYVQLLEREAYKSPGFKPFVDKTLVQVRKLDSLIADLLDVSKQESGKLEFNYKYFDFDNMVRNVVDIARESNESYQIEIKGKIGTSVYGDESRLEQVLTNYLTNAVKYSPNEKAIQVMVDEHDSKAQVSVKDSGIGIAKHEQKNLFKKFYRAEDVAAHFQGMGIGLFICSEIIQRHNGTIGVESEPQKGSTFYFSIPIHN